MKKLEKFIELKIKNPFMITGGDDGDIEREKIKKKSNGKQDDDDVEGGSDEG